MGLDEGEGIQNLLTRAMAAQLAARVQYTGLTQPDNLLEVNNDFTTSKCNNLTTLVTSLLA